MYQCVVYSVSDLFATFCAIINGDFNKKVMLSQGEPRDVGVAVNFNK